MHRSSDTIGALAGALAKAQAELANPEKSLIATIPAALPREENRTFRYASLSSGLDLVRKCLGRHEIATMQTTAVDPKAGLIHLTTVLAHASGEWMSSDWPVCAVTETNAPHRMGAALTYARRYALFTLVGIAGEDDLDAPDLSGSAIQEMHSRTMNSPRVLQPAEIIKGAASIKSAKRSLIRQPATLQLDEASSAECRDGLLADLAPLLSTDELDRWAFKTLPTKSCLTKSDARQIETAFAAKISTLHVAHTKQTTDLAQPNEDTQVFSPGRIDKSALAIPELRRVRDKAHLRFVGQQPCLVCERQPCDAHHLRFAQSRGIGIKVSDEFTVPLCRAHHREVHRVSIELRWWQRLGIDATKVARKLWIETHPLPATVPDVDEMVVLPKDKAPLTEPSKKQNGSTKRTQFNGGSHP